MLDTTTNKPVVNLTSTTLTSYSLTTLAAGDNFTWYIGAETSKGVNGAISWSSQTFALAAPTAPTQLVPIGAAGTTSPTFSWSPVLGANHYYLYLLDTTTNTVVLNDSSVSGTTFGVSGLTHGHSYTWYVAAVNLNGSDYFSGPASFTV